jgi:hypothetical protein
MTVDESGVTVSELGVAGNVRREASLEGTEAPPAFTERTW